MPATAARSATHFPRATVTIGLMGGAVVTLLLAVPAARDQPPAKSPPPLAVRDVALPVPAALAVLDPPATAPELLGSPHEDASAIEQPTTSIPAGSPKPDVVFIPTPRKVVEEMLHLAAVKPGEVLFDLGSGDGRIPIMAAAQFGARTFGYEIDAGLVRESQDAVRRQHLEKQVTIERRDIFQLDLSRADVVTLYLLPTLNEKLLPQLEKMRLGTRIVSHDFPIAGIRPKTIKRVKASDERGQTREHWLYLWTLPLEKERRY